MQISVQRLTLITGITAFAGLLLLAMVYYLERIAHIDMAFQTFLILKSGSPEIQSGRFGAVATQCWPWMAQAAELPLKWVLRLYSAGHVIWPALLFGWALWLRQWKWALVLLLAVTGMATQTFYWLSEMPQGLVFLIAVMAWISGQPTLRSVRWWQWPLWLFAAVTAFYFHPLVLYAAVFACLFMIISPESGEKKWYSARWPVYTTFLAMLGATALVKYKVLKLDWYDAAAMKRTAAFGQLWPNWLDIQSNRDLWTYLLSDYWFIPAALGVSLIYYVARRQWLKGGLTLLYPVVFVFAVNVPYSESTHQFYMENLWLPLGLFAAMPLVMDVLPGWFGDRKTVVIAAFLALSGIYRIAGAHESWTARLNWERQFLSTSGNAGGRLILTEKQIPMDTFKLSWAMTYEFLLLSALDTPGNTRAILVTGEPHKYDTLRCESRLLLGPFKNYPYEVLPKRYFMLNDTTCYTEMRLEEN
jgi:hypothetical protein